MTHIPEEFLSALASDASATTRFAGLPENEKEHILGKARSAKSAQEIEHIVSRL